MWELRDYREYLYYSNEKGEDKFVNISVEYFSVKNSVLIFKL